SIIRQLPNNKSPGIDGLIYEFYKLIEEYITPILEKIFNQILESGILPTLWCKNLIILISKKATDLSNLDNWWPISLVANRLNKICDTLIPSYQQEAHIVDSGELSSPFRVERGVRQGDLLSPLLYTLAFEPLLITIESKIRGIPVQKQHFKTVAYADNLTIGIGCPSDWNT
ncbi:5155_t:CDS:2, partial [Ambispora leptoticha]